MGHFVLMGRKTFESIKKPLEGRKIIIITKNKNYKTSAGYVVHSIKKAIELALKEGEDELFIAGGETIYQQTIDIAEKIYLTKIEKNYNGDSFFPEFKKYNYELLYERPVNTYTPIKFLIYGKKA